MSDLNLTNNFKKISELKNTSLAEFQKQVLEISNLFTDRTVVALSGPMGAGKTEFVKTLAQAYGVSGAASPTFAIHHRYQGQNSIGKSTTLEHLDLYRLQSEDELESTGFWDFFLEPTGLILIEWPERMNLNLVPQQWQLILVQITVNDTERVIQVFTRL